MSDLPPRLARMAALVGSEREFNYTVHVWTDPGFVFFSNPICACSTLKMSLNLSVARATGRKDFRIEAAGDIHKRAANLLQTPREIGYDRLLAMLDDPEVPVFAFVRSPESRFLSAFRKKLTRETNFTRKVRAHLGLDMDVPLSQFLTLDRFAQSVAADETMRDLDEHWRLQRKQIFYDAVPRLEIGFVESFSADAARILGRIFGPDGYVLRDATELNPANASGNRKAAPLEVSDLVRDCVAAAYTEDAAMIAEIRSKAAARTIESKTT